MADRSAGPAWEDGDAGLPLAVDLVVELVGTTFRLASTSAEAADVLVSLLGPFAGPSRPVAPWRRYAVVDPCRRHGGACCVHRGGRPLRAPTERGEALAWLLAELNSSALHAFTGFAVHAGVLSGRQGAIAFPASSGEGKTTLAAAGALVGLEYVSDEALCVDFASREVIAYPRPLALSPWSRHRVGLDHVDGHELSADEFLVAPRHLGAGAPATGLHLAHLVRLVRRSGPPALVPAGRADAMAWLLEHSFNHYKRPAEAFRLCAALAGGARAWRLELSDPLEAAHLVAERLAAGG